MRDWPQSPSARKQHARAHLSLSRADGPGGMGTEECTVSVPASMQTAVGAGCAVHAELHSARLRGLIPETIPDAIGSVACRL